MMGFLFPVRQPTAVSLCACVRATPQPPTHNLTGVKVFSLRASTLQKERSSTRSLASVLRIKCIFLLRKKQNCQYPGFYHLFLRLVAGRLCLLEKKHGQALARCPTTLASGTVATGAMCPLQPCAGAQQAGPGSLRARVGGIWPGWGSASPLPPSWEGCSTLWAKAVLCCSRRCVSAGSTWRCPLQPH